MTFPHSTFNIAMFSGFSKFIFCRLISLINKHLFFIIIVKLKAKIANKIKKTKIIFSNIVALIFFIIIKIQKYRQFYSIYL